MIIRHKENVWVRLILLLYVSFMYSVDLSEFIFTYDNMFGFHIACLMSSMSLDRCVLIFDV